MATKKTAKKVELVSEEVNEIAPAPVGRVLKPLTGEIAKNEHFSAAQLADQMDRLLQMRERISGEILSISKESLGKIEQELSLSDQGTDTFDREFALNQLSSEQDILFEIDEAIRRIEAGTYGVCEMSGDVIRFERLQALPYVRCTTAAQSEVEKGQKKYREFGRTIHGY